jgi:adenosylhomocysteine nucleosidase
MSTGPDRTGNVGLVIALPAEARSIGVRGIHAGQCKRWRGGWVAVSGIGPHNAMHAANQLVMQGVAQLANWGVAGALDANLMPGDIVIPDRILYSTGDHGYEPDMDACQRLATALSGKLKVSRGALWSTHEAIATGEAKRELAARSHALAIDMEAAPVAAVAQRHSLPFIAVKAICDTAGQDLPGGIADTLGQSDSGMSLRMLGAITLAGPNAWRATGKLAGHFAQARHALAIAARLADPMAFAPG